MTSPARRARTGQALRWARRISVVALALAAVLMSLAYAGFRLEDHSPVAPIVGALWLGMIIGSGAALVGLGRRFRLRLPALAWWQTAVVLLLLAVGTFSSCGAMLNLPSDGQAAVVNGAYVVQAHGSVVRDITKGEYERETNLLAYLFFGIALAVWSTITLVAFMAAPKDPSARPDLSLAAGLGSRYGVAIIFRRSRFESELSRDDFVLRLRALLVSGWRFHLDADRGALSGRVTSDGFRLRVRASSRGNAIWVVGSLDPVADRAVGRLRVLPEPMTVISLLLMLAVSIVVQFLAPISPLVRTAVPAAMAVAAILYLRFALREWLLIKARLKHELGTQVDD